MPFRKIACEKMPAALPDFFKASHTTCTMLCIALDSFLCVVIESSCLFSRQARILGLGLALGRAFLRHGLLELGEGQHLTECLEPETIRSLFCWLVNGMIS